MIMYQDETQESYDVEYGNVYSGNAGLGTIGSRVSAAGTMFPLCLLLMQVLMFKQMYGVMY